MLGWRRIARTGVCGMNRRNRELVYPHNPRRCFPLVDDKLRTKQRLTDFGLPAPTLLDVIDTPLRARSLESRLRRLRDGFVVKPARGAAGRGIVVVAALRAGELVKPSGGRIGFDELRRHVLDGLAGVHSLSGDADRMFVEALLRPHDALAELSVGGVPDLRVIVRGDRPVMAMLRLATRASDGKANLARGAIGVGIDLETGCTTRAIRHGLFGDTELGEHPDTGAPLIGVQVPQWRRVLAYASRCPRVFGLGFLGVDIVLDAARGPVILELNARPGLSIQNANGAGLWSRLRDADPG